MEYVGVLVIVQHKIHRVSFSRAERSITIDNFGSLKRRRYVGL